MRKASDKKDKRTGGLNSENLINVLVLLFQTIEYPSSTLSAILHHFISNSIQNRILILKLFYKVLGTPTSCPKICQEGEKKCAGTPASGCSMPEEICIPSKGKKWSLETF